MQKRIRVLYIAGSSRGGSTLLDRLLGQVEGFFSAGEMRFVWERGIRDNQLCGCGKPFDKCETWAGIIRRAFGDSLRDDRKIETAMGLLSSLTRLRNFPLVRAGLLRSHVKALCEEYLLPFYSAISEETGGKIIIDSSKTSSYLHALSMCGSIDLYVVHLHRDPRAVAYSWSRRRHRPEITGREEYMPRVSSLRSSMLWVLEHRLIARTGRQLGKRRYMVLKYEDLARSPKAAVRGVLDFFGVEDDLSFFTGEHRADLKPNHTASGNPMRFKTGPLDIRHDDEWTREMGFMDKLTASLITYPTRRLYR